MPQRRSVMKMPEGLTETDVAMLPLDVMAPLGMAGRVVGRPFIKAGVGLVDEAGRVLDRFRDLRQLDTKSLEMALKKAEALAARTPAAEAIEEVKRVTEYFWSRLKGPSLSEAGRFRGPGTNWNIKK